MSLRTNDDDDDAAKEDAGDEDLRLSRRLNGCPLCNRMHKLQLKALFKALLLFYYDGQTAAVQWIKIIIIIVIFTNLGLGSTHMRLRFMQICTATGAFERRCIAFVIKSLASGQQLKLNVLIPSSAVHDLGLGQAALTTKCLERPFFPFHYRCTEPKDPFCGHLIDMRIENFH